MSSLQESSIQSEHECIILLSVTLYPTERILNSSSPDATIRSIIPLDSTTLFPQSVIPYTVCCYLHAHRLQIQYFTGLHHLQPRSDSTHAPLLILRSSHTLTFRHIEPTSNFRRIATLLRPDNSVLQFTYRDIICACCPQHADQFSLLHHMSFDIQLETSADYELPPVSIISELPGLSSRPVPSALSTPTLSSAPSFHTDDPYVPSRSPASPSVIPSTPAQPRDPISQSRQPISAPALPLSGMSAYASSVAPSEQLRPSERTLLMSPSLAIPPRPSVTPATSRHTLDPTNAPLSASISRIPPTASHIRANPNLLPEDTDTPGPITPDPQYEARPISFRESIFIIRLQMLLCLHVLDQPSPFQSAVILARQLLRYDPTNHTSIRINLAHYSVDVQLLVQHLQDYHTHVILSATDTIDSAARQDPHNCRVQRCLFYNRTSFQANATVYRPSFNALLSYHMLDSRLRDINHDSIPLSQLTVQPANDTTMVYSLPNNEFEVFLSTFDPSRFAEIPSPEQTAYVPSNRSISSSSSSLRSLRPRRGYHQPPRP